MGEPTVTATYRGHSRLCSYSDDLGSTTWAIEREGDYGWSEIGSTESYDLALLMWHAHIVTLGNGSVWG